MTFLSARPAAPGDLTGSLAPVVAIFGVPFDATSTFRPGSRYGPSAVRWASQSIETYSPVLDRDLEDASFADLGDLETDGMDVEAMTAAVRAFADRLPAQAVPVVLGGEHTISLGVVQSLRIRHPDLVILQLDAHTDLRDTYEGRRLSHATVMRRIADESGGGSIVQLGVRAGTREEFALARRTLRLTTPRLEIPAEVRGWLEDRPVYVTIDIDVLDPSHAPGTGNPEPEGAAVDDLLGVIRRLGLFRVVGLDLVEVSPPYDPSGRTAIVAAAIIREAILAISPTPA